MIITQPLTANHIQVCTTHYLYNLQSWNLQTNFWFIIITIPHFVDDPDLTTPAMAASKGARQHMLSKKLYEHIGDFAALLLHDHLIYAMSKLVPTLNFNQNYKQSNSWQNKISTRTKIILSIEIWDLFGAVCLEFSFIFLSLEICRPRGELLNTLTCNCLSCFRMSVFPT